MSIDPLEPLPDDPLPEVEPETAPAVPEDVSCPRCRLTTPHALYCMHCQAMLVTKMETAPYRDFTPPPNRLKPLFIAYVLFLATSIILTLIVHADSRLTHDGKLNWYITALVIDTIITLSLFLFIGWAPARTPRLWKRITAWCLAPFASVSAYFLGDYYIEMIQKYIDDKWHFQFIEQKFTLFEVITTAVQPAIVEELFFRYFAYGVLRQLTHAHSAVFLSSLMFALAHLYNPLGLPYLFGMGLMLGYARVYSGGLILPMLMHFGHNFAIIYVESLK